MSEIVLNAQEEHWYLFELREAGRVVGRLQFWAKGEDAYVHWIEVDEKARRRGLAVELYTSLKTWCEANGVLWLNGRIEDRYALRARNRVFGEPFDVEALEPMDDSSSSILFSHARGEGAFGAGALVDRGEEQPGREPHHPPAAVRRVRSGQPCVEGTML